MTTLDDVTALARPEQLLMTVATVRADGTIQASLVNAGVMGHPIAGEPVLAFVTYGPAKLGNLRARPQITLTVRSGWQWATVEGRAEIIGPDDPHPAVDADAAADACSARSFTAAGGTHDDWDAYDAEMVAQGRSAVLVSPDARLQQRLTRGCLRAAAGGVEETRLHRRVVTDARRSRRRRTGRSPRAAAPRVRCSPTRGRRARRRARSSAPIARARSHVWTA